MLPSIFKDRMKTLLKEEYESFIDSYNETDVKSIRVNTLKVSVEDFIKLSPFELEKIPYTSDGFYVKEVLGNHPYHHAGLYYAQDPAAMMPVNAINLESDMIVLDLCAAPGGKSTQIGTILKDGILVSNEINPNRAKILFSNIERIGLKNTIILNNSSYELAKKYPHTFDVIFIDAPCSGEGMFRKDSNAIKDWSPKKVEECAKIQSELLKNSDTMLKDGGFIVYSTCTYSLEEDELQISEFLKDHDYEIIEVNDKLKPFVHSGYVDDNINKELKKAVRFYPHIAKGEGQFACILKKKGVLVKTKLEFKTNDILDKYIKDDVDIKLNAEIINNYCYTKLPFDIKGMKIISSGVKLGEIKGDRFIYHHNFITAYGKYFKNKLNLDLNDPRLIKYLHGYEIEDGSVKNGYGVILVNNYPLGLFKASNGRVKNHYPSGLRVVDSWKN